MNAKLEKYLNTVEKHLNPLPASERIDIVKEIKSLIIELENDNVPTEIIINRLGDPKELAKAYLGNLLANSKGFSWNRRGRKIFCVYGKNSSLIRNRYV